MAAGVEGPSAAEWADFRRADPEAVRLLAQADALILQGRREEGERRLLDLLRPDVLVLDTDLYDESGWLACAKIVRDHGGIIECESQARRTIFRVLMPMFLGDDAEPGGAA